MVNFNEDEIWSRPDVYNKKYHIETFLDPEASVLGEVQRTKGYLKSQRSFPRGCSLDNDIMVIGMSNTFLRSGDERLGFSWFTSRDFGTYPFYTCPYDPDVNVKSLVSDSFEAIIEYHHDLYNVLPSRYFFYRDISQGSVSTPKIEEELDGVKDAIGYKGYEWGKKTKQIDFLTFRPHAPFNPNPANFRLGENYFEVQTVKCECCVDNRKAFVREISDYDNWPVVNKMARNFAGKNVYEVSNEEPMDQDEGIN